MSLLIVGSCSKITQNIVLQLGKNKQYSKITIADLLPEYDFHNRYYKLRKDINENRLSVSVALTKLTKIQDIYQNVNQHDDVLYVTPDYFSHVTSKTKLMELTAHYASKKKHLYFATPLQYDHYGFANPEENYLEGQKKAIALNPHSTIIRSDVQDAAEAYAYIFKTKPIWQQKFLNIPQSFRPKVVSSLYYANLVAQTLQKKSQSKVICVRGAHELSYNEVTHNKHLQNFEIDHHAKNVIQLVNKYRGLNDKDSEIAVSASS